MAKKLMDMIKRIMVVSRIFSLKLLSNIATACTPAEVEAPFTASTAPAEWPKSPTRLARAGQLLRSLKQCDNVLACGEGRPFERRCFRARNDLLKGSAGARLAAAKPAAGAATIAARPMTRSAIQAVVQLQVHAGMLCSLSSRCNQGCLRQG